MTLTPLTLEKFGLSIDTIRIIEDNGVDSNEVCKDIVDLRSGRLKAIDIMEACLTGSSGSEHLSAWREYVGMIVHIAGV